MSRTSKFWILLLFSLLGACGTTHTEHQGLETSSQSVSLTTAAENLGQQVERHLRTRYANTAVNCGQASQPAFLCSGIMIRGTATNPTFHVWNNSPASLLKGGVSFSYLRRDANYRQMPFYYTNGYIFQSYFHAEEKLHPEVLCSFPIDGWTDRRPQAGCGASAGLPDSAACETVSVLTGEQWWSRYGATSIYTTQCGFNVQDSRNELAGPAFDASIKSRGFFNEAQSIIQNEIIVKVWQDNLGATLPLEAFFYLHGTVGLRDAQRNQRDLKATDGVVIPIISIRFARNATEAATFYYLPEDQVETMPPARP